MVNGRLERESNPPTGQLASPVPQYKIPGEDNYEKLEGQHGASFTKIKDAEGTVVSPATEAQLEQVKEELALVKAELQAIKTNQLSGDQKVTVSGTFVEDVVLQNAAVATGNGTAYTATNGNMVLSFEVVGTSTSRNVEFEMTKSGGSVWQAVTCFNVLDPSVTAASTTGGSNTSPESWQVDVPCGWSFRARISAVAGGTVTVAGKAVLS
jgi:hypothetical protein